MTGSPFPTPEQAATDRMTRMLPELASAREKIDAALRENPDRNGAHHLDWPKGLSQAGFDILATELRAAGWTATRVSDMSDPDTIVIRPREALDDHIHGGSLGRVRDGW